MAAERNVRQKLSVDKGRSEELLMKCSRSRSVGVAFAAILLSLIFTAEFDGGRAAAHTSREAAQRRVERVSAPAYFGVEIRAHQFNMCSVQCGTRLPANDLIDYLEALDNPWSISLNELCIHDIQSLAFGTGMDVQAVVADNYVQGCPATDKRYGNAILTVGPYLTSRAFQFSDATQGSECTDPDGRKECRVGICREVDGYAGRVVPCSAHLGGISSAQATEYRNTVNTFYGTRGRWPAGDFNLTPGNVPSGWPQQFFNASFPYFSYNARATIDRQLDYIWHDRVHSAFNDEVVPFCDGFYSDHCYVFAKFG